MKRFVEGANRGQSTLLPESLDEWVEESNSVRVIDCFVDSLDLADLGFEGVEPAATGRCSNRPLSRKQDPLQTWTPRRVLPDTSILRCPRPQSRDRLSDGLRGAF